MTALMPDCRKGVLAHDWNEGELSRYCSSCWLVQPYPLPKFKGRKTRGTTKRLAPVPKKRPVRIIRSDPPKDRRRLVIERDGFICQYCQRPVRETNEPTAPDRLTIDHRVPRCLGGKNNIENLVVACNECNHAKGDKLPHEFFVGPKGGLTKRQAAELSNERMNRHTRSHFRRDGQPKKAFDRDDAYETAEFLARRDNCVMDAFQCDECDQWHVRIYVGMHRVKRRALIEQRHRFFDDALRIELGPRAVGQLKAENHRSGRVKMIALHFKGAERRAKHARCSSELGK